MSPEELVCPSCGAPITSFGEKICPFCHQPLPADTARAAARPVRSSTMQYWMLGLPLICCCAPGAAFWILLLAPWSRRTKWIVGGVLAALSLYQAYVTVHFWVGCTRGCTTEQVFGWPF